MRKHASLVAVCAAIAMTTVAAPASGQGIMGTLRNLKTSVEGLSGKRRPTTDQQAESAAASSGVDPISPTVVDDGDNGMVSLSALRDDPSDTNLASAPLRAGSIATYDVLGLRLGMSPREVHRIAKRIPIPRKFDQPSWQGTFELEATRIANQSLSKPLNARSPRTIAHDWGIMRDGSQVEVEFTLEPAGPRMSSLNYSTKQNGQTQDQVRTALIAKYGRPDWDMGYQMWWCGGVPKCDGVMTRVDTMQISMIDQRVNFSLVRGATYLQNAKKVIEMRAQEIAGKAGKPIAF